MFLGTIEHPLLFLRVSLVGSIIISMTYSINIQPYNDPYIVIAEKAGKATAELVAPGAFFVDIIPILKYVPEWFPGANFHRKAAALRKHADVMRNKTFTATKELMVCGTSPFFDWYLMIRIHS